MPTQENNKLYLVIDQGGHASRALVFDHQGKLISKHYCEIETNYPNRDWVEHDVEMLLASVKHTMSASLEQLGKKKKQVCAAGLATQRSSVVCWNRTFGQGLSNVISWQDRRESAWMETFSAQKDLIKKTTGLFPSPHYGVSKLHWCLEHLPKVKTALINGDLVLGPLASFIIARITEEGSLFVDPSNASRTLLFNQHTSDWDPHLLETFQIPLEALPKNVPARFPFGHIAMSGLQIPLSYVTGDQTAALFLEGAPGDDSLYINLGTGAFLQRAQNKPIQTNRLLSSVVLTNEGKKRYVLEGTVNGVGAALSWFANTYRAETWQNKAEAWLRSAKEPPIFMNTIGGLGSPYWIPHLVSRFIGDGDITARFRSVIESILFLIQANLDEMNRYTQAPTLLIVSGGPASLDFLCQGLANLCAIQVRRPSQSEATCRGLAYLLTNAPSSWSAPTPAKIFSPKKDEGLHDRYALWSQEMAKAIASI